MRFSDGFKIIGILLINIIFLSCSGKSPTGPDTDENGLSLEVSFIDIRGSIGDATLIHLSNGKTILIDAGEASQGTSYVVPYIRSQNITHINFVIATHYHADHIGGIPAVLSNFDVDSVLDRGYSFDSQPYIYYYNAVRGKRRAVARGDTLWLAEGAFVACVAVNGNGIVPDLTNPNNENDLSAAFHIKFGKFDLFVGGDLTGGGSGTYDIESRIANDVGMVEVYKVNHHGSNTSSNNYFLSVIRPIVSVISVGNYVGLPSDTVCARLRTYGDLFITKNDGNVVITVKSEEADSFEVKTSRTGISRFYRCHRN